VAALAASSCCLGPLFLAALGLGGAGATAAVAAYRPCLLALTAVLLGAGFYLTYRRSRVTVDACGCERPRANRMGRIGLWTATGVVVLVAAAPPLLAKWADLTRPHVRTQANASLASATFDVHGIDCAACAAPIRKALARAGGFRDLELDVPKQAVRVTYEPAPGRVAAYVAAMDDLGYETKVQDASEARR
jgi:mercuric ion transport protein